jgi:hypothetical protein
MDKKGKETGPGKVRERLSGGRGAILTVDLFNYNIDGNLLKDEHKTWIEDKLLPLLQKFAVHVKLLGTASKSGDREYNRQLSLERVLRVKKHLIEKGVPESKVPGPDVHHAGEDLSKSDSHEDELDRAVAVTIALGTKPRPIFPTILLDEIVIRPDRIELPPTIIVVPPTLKPIPIKVSQKWSIKLLSAADGSVKGVPIFHPQSPIGFGVGPSAAFFQVVDRTNNLEVACVFTGANGGFGVGPGSFTLEGDPKDFTTEKPQRITDFAGDAIWDTVFSTGPFSHNELTVPNIAGRGPFPLIVKVPTGTTFGASGPNRASGKMVCSNPRQRR